MEVNRRHFLWCMGAGLTIAVLGALDRILRLPPACRWRARLANAYVGRLRPWNLEKIKSAAPWAG